MLASRRPRHPVGWLLLTLGLTLITSGVAAGYVPYGLGVRPGILPAANLVARLYPAVTDAALAALGFILLLHPHWIAPLAPLALVGLGLGNRDGPAARGGDDRAGPAGPHALLAGGPQDFRAFGGALRLANQAAQAVAILTILAGTVSLVVRFRRARGVERLQLRWVALAAALMGVAVAGVAVLVTAGALGLASWVAVLGVVLLPLAIGAAILRYRLYGLDYFISRTLVYGLLTAAGVAVYMGVVKLSEWLLREGHGAGEQPGGGGGHRGRASRRPGTGSNTGSTGGCTANGTTRRAPWPDSVNASGTLRRPAARMCSPGCCRRCARPCGCPRPASASTRGWRWQSFGRQAAASESIPLEHEGQQHRGTAGRSALRRGRPRGGRPARSWRSWPPRWRWPRMRCCCRRSCSVRGSGWWLPARRNAGGCAATSTTASGPILTAVTLKADAARSVLDAAPDRHRALLAELRGDANQAIGDLRRVVYDLRPAALDELGLLGALGQQVDRFARQGLSIALHAPPALPVLPAAVEVAAYRIITEALTNVARHAHAHRVTIAVAIDGDALSRGPRRRHHKHGQRRPLAARDRAAVHGRTRRRGRRHLGAGPTPTGGRV